MAIWAIADLHLSFGVPQKTMDIFGPKWVGYTEKIKDSWERLITHEDLVLIAGDISWASKAEDALIDLKWIEKLPGTKLLLRGNHDYWWPSATKLRAMLPPSIHFIQNNAFHWNDVSIGGSRLWDCEEYRFNTYVEFLENPKAKPASDTHDSAETTRTIFQRELIRLKHSLDHLKQDAKIKIAMTHYPPIGSELKTSSASEILEHYGINICVFGHLHNIKKGCTLFGAKNAIRYLLTSCDYLDFTPLKIL